MHYRRCPWPDANRIQLWDSSLELSDFPIFLVSSLRIFCSRRTTKVISAWHIASTSVTRNNTRRIPVRPRHCSCYFYTECINLNLYLNKDVSSNAYFVSREKERERETCYDVRWLTRYSLINSSRTKLQRLPKWKHVVTLKENKSDLEI